ncbi:MAG: hypothetical protein LBH04_02020 [Tannerellaceae bacterium]|jgi:hypothetical protein|nr:hypothetical protein [Tannerellaceae bacterium]
MLPNFTQPLDGIPSEQSLPIYMTIEQTANPPVGAPPTHGFAYRQLMSLRTANSPVGEHQTDWRNGRLTAVCKAGDKMYLWR